MISSNHIANILFILIFYPFSVTAATQDRPNTCGLHQKMAADGDAKSQVLIGHCYRTGKSGETDLAEAKYWYQKAADAGNDSGMLSLANLYIFDMKCEDKYEEAIGLLESAQSKGNVNALFVLGLLRLNGIGMKKDIELAKSYFRRASDKGHGWSMLTMYTMVSNQTDKNKWKNAYEEVYGDFYSWETGYTKYKADKKIQQYVFQAVK